MENQPISTFLNRLLANYFVLYVKLHRYSWYAKGEHIITQQTYYKNLYLNIKADIDFLAEHILFIDGKPYATMNKYLKSATLVEASADDETDEMVDQLISDMTEIITMIDKEGYVQANNLDDALTNELLIKLVRRLLKIKQQLNAFHH